MEKITENTPFVIDGQSLGITMLDFWKYQYSNIYDMQEYIAEFIVGKALGIDEPINRDGWTLYDIFYGNKRIEVKETGYYYSWQKNGKISKHRTFGITSAYGSDNVKARQNDIYVFCLNTGTNAGESNPLEMSNWEFYVVPTAVINANCAPKQKSISLGKVRKLAPMTRFQDLKSTIDAICKK